MKFLKCCGRICVVLDMLVLIPIFGTNPNAYSQWTHMKFLNYCRRICVVLDMLVLIPIFGTSSTHIPSGHT